MAGQRHRARRDHRRQQHSSRPHGRLLRAGRALKLPAGAARQCRTPLESASERGGRPRRTTAYLDELPELELPELEPLALLELELLAPVLPELSPPGERPVVELAAAPFVELVGGLPETLSFFATFFLAFFALCFGLAFVSVETVDDVVSLAARVLRSFAVVFVLASA